MARYNFQTDGDFVDFTDSGNLVVRLHNSSRCIKWRYDDTPGISFAIDSFEIQTDVIGDISFDGTPLTEQSGFETAVTAMFPGLAGGGEGGGIEGIERTEDNLSYDANSHLFQLAAAGAFIIQGSNGSLLDIDQLSVNSKLQSADGTAESIVSLEADSADSDVSFYIRSDDGVNRVEIAGNAIENTLVYDADTHTFSGAAIIMAALPTADPSVAGQLWNDGGTLKISAG